jgi:hypothetical protein
VGLNSSQVIKYGVLYIAVIAVFAALIVVRECFSMPAARIIVNALLSRDLPRHYQGALQLVSDPVNDAYLVLDCTSYTTRPYSQLSRPFLVRSSDYRLCSTFTCIEHFLSSMTPLFPCVH